MGQERLRRSDRDFRPSVGVQHGIGFPWNRRSHRVANRQRTSTLGLRVAKCHEGVHRFTGLGYGDDEGIWSDDRISVPKLARQFDINGQSRPMFNGVLRHHAGMSRSSTGNHDDLGDVAQHRVIERCLIQFNALLRIDASTKRIGDGFGLFCDFLEHEQVVPTLFRR